MSTYSGIHWCDGTINPVAGCDGCELFETRPQVIARVAKAIDGDQVEARKTVAAIAERFADETPKKASIHLIQAMLDGGLINADQALALMDETNKFFKCYAATLCEMRNNKAGWPDRFDKPKLFPGRMAQAAALKDLSGTDRNTEDKEKPWLNGQPRVIFVSDMGDALSHGVEFEYLRDEIINQVITPKGSRHVWLWLTKRPRQMAMFAKYLAEQNIAWPDNLVAMTTVTSADNAYRVKDLLEVPAKMRGLSIEPLWGELTLDLTGIDWVIVGGESGPSAEPFQVEWALSLRDQCQKAGVKFFIKQLGKNPLHGGQPVVLDDRKFGGDWDQWPAEWRVRDVPNFASLVTKIEETNPAKPKAALKQSDVEYRTTLEATVTEGLNAGLKAALALCEIRDYDGGVLWRADYSSFVAYCAAKWGYSSSHAYRLADCGVFMKALEEANTAEGATKIALPVNECQVRPILALPKEAQVAAWGAAVGDASVETLTGAAIAEKVKDRLPPKAPRAPKASIEAVVTEAPASSAVEMLTELETALSEHAKYAEIAGFIESIRALVAA